MSSKDWVTGALAHALSAMRRRIAARRVVLPLPMGPHKTRCSPLVSLSARSCAIRRMPSGRVTPRGSGVTGGPSPTAAGLVE